MALDCPPHLAVVPAKADEPLLLYVYSFASFFFRS